MKKVWKQVLRRGFCGLLCGLLCGGWVFAEQPEAQQAGLAGIAAPCAILMDESGQVL